MLEIPQPFDFMVNLLLACELMYYGLDYTVF